MARPLHRTVAIALAFTVAAAACTTESDSPEAVESTTESATASTAATNDDPVTTPATTTTAASTTTTSTTATTSTTTTLAPKPEPDDSILTEAPSAGGITLGSDEFTFSAGEFDPEIDLDGEGIPAALGLIGDDGEGGVVVIPVDAESEIPFGEVIFVEADGTAWFGEGARFVEDGSVITAAGTAATADGSGEEPFEVRLALGVGTSTFELDGNEATVRGDLGSATFDQVEYLIEQHPQVDTLVLADIPGSVNDEVNVETGRLVRNAGLSTFVPADGQIFSGGVDLFAAGVDRTTEPGAIIGVHAWCCGPSGESAHLLAQDSRAHASQLAYFTEMLGPDLGPAFYFFTLQAAPFDGMETMTTTEIDYFELSTEPIVLGTSSDVTAAATDVLAESPAATAEDAADVITQSFFGDALAENGALERVVTVEGDTTTVVTVATGLLDDSSNAAVLTLTFEATDAGVSVSAATFDPVCSRGLSDGLCV